MNGRIYKEVPKLKQLKKGADSRPDAVEELQSLARPQWLFIRFRSVS